MLQRIRVVTVALAMGAGALALTPPASAEVQVAAPEISKVRMSPASPIVVSGKAVTATFTFFAKDATSAEFQLKAPGQTGVFTPVNVDAGAKRGDWTRFTATKSFDAASAGTWNFLAIAKGDGEASTKGAFEVKKELPTTKIVEFDANPDRVDAGDGIRVSGRLELDDKGYSGQKVTITFRDRGTDAYRHVTDVTSGRNGWFAARVRAESTGWWRAEFAATSAAGGSVSDTDRVSVRVRDRDSRITGFDARPELVTKGDRLSFTGTLSTDDRALPGQRVTIRFKAHGSRHWQYVTSDVTNRHGRFWVSTTAEESGWWRADFRGARGVDGSVSRPNWVRVTEPPEKSDSRIIGFNASPEPVERGDRLRIWAALQIDDDGDWDGQRGKVRLYFKANGSDTYRYVKSTWSGESGRLFTTVRAWDSGRWRFVYGGDEDTNGDTSRSDYVRVRR
ncbi:hypothetical protein ACIBQX_08760 [Nonomuraea sp. NPDC049714]|uniref:hypothetical protein n=1 Tax=Nonomuraea sp. NPDC049714 TaxID=3364357 RepID=UPI0037AEDBAF